MSGRKPEVYNGWMCPALLEQQLIVAVKKKKKITVHIGKKLHTAATVCSNGSTESQKH